MEAQRLTLQEQRNHIEILDTALINAQNNIMTLENELRSKQQWEEKTLFLEKALSNLQSTNERRLQMEKRIRTYLEKELEKFKNIHNNNLKNNTGDSRTNDNNNNQQQQSSSTTTTNIDDVDALKASIVNYEKKIIDLEAEVSKWEQKYLEENTLRSIEVSAASAPKDAKIAALERTSHESEKLIAEARNERLKHMDEIHIANRKCAELESQLKDLNFKLAEKETIINVLQKHSDDRDAVLQKTLRFTNNVTAARHTKSASTMGLVVGTNNNGSNSINNINNNNNNNNRTTMANDYQLKIRTSANGSLVIDTDSAINLDEQIKEIESSQLSNK
ncbi:angiomotin-like protein, partial [Euroglyphus maynei]